MLKYCLKVWPPGKIRVRDVSLLLYKEDFRLDLTNKEIEILNKLVPVIEENI